VSYLPVDFHHQLGLHQRDVQLFLAAPPRGERPACPRMTAPPRSEQARRRRPRRVRPVEASRTLAPCPPRPLPHQPPPPDVTAALTAARRGGPADAQPAERALILNSSQGMAKGVATGMSAARPRRTTVVTWTDFGALWRPAQHLPQHSAQHLANTQRNTGPYEAKRRLGGLVTVSRATRSRTSRQITLHRICRSPGGHRWFIT
jgi:hypothetical protein